MRPTVCVECNGHLDPVLPDCPECGAHVPQSDEHHDRDITFEDTDPQLGHRTVARKRRFHFPWGLLVLLAVYFAGAKAFLYYRQINSPSYQALQKVQAAMALLGKDRGETTPIPKLEEAYSDLLDAAPLVPGDRSIDDEMEEIGKIIVRRGHQIDPALKRKADMMAMQYERIDQSQRGMFVSDARARWDFGALADSSEDLSKYLVLGGLVIVILWAYREFQDRVHATKQDDEKHLLRREELASLHSHRKR